MSEYPKIIHVDGMPVTVVDEADEARYTTPPAKDVAKPTHPTHKAPADHPKKPRG